jgi:hypothetical protein
MGSGKASAPVKRVTKLNENYYRGVDFAVTVFIAEFECFFELSSLFSRKSLFLHLIKSISKLLFQMKVFKFDSLTYGKYNWFKDFIDESYYEIHRIEDKIPQFFI